MADASWADWVTAFGTMLAGLAAAAAVVLGWSTAKAWREQARAAREAEVAGEALVVVLQYLARLRRMTAMYRNTDHMADDVHVRWEGNVAAENELKLAIARTTAYLPAEAPIFLLSVLAQSSNLYGDQWGWAISMDAGDASRDDFDRVFGSHRREVLDELETQAVALFKPLARVDHRKK